MTHVAFERTDHRPWPVPASPWVGRQSWCDLLFAHWRMPLEALRPHVPEGLEVETFDGAAWLGVVPFRMEGVMLRGLPDIPGLSAFPEVNVRTYVRRGDRPGVWFFSLDATRRIAVWTARRFVHLPYHHADIELREDTDAIACESHRRDGEATLVCEYAPTSPPREPRAGTLEHWLTERYCLYALAPDGALRRTDVHHAPWPLCDARCTIERNTMLAPLGLAVTGPPELAHFSRRQDVVAWAPMRC